MPGFAWLFPPVEVMSPFFDVWEQFLNTVLSHFENKAKYNDCCWANVGVENEMIPHQIPDW